MIIIFRVKYRNYRINIYFIFIKFDGREYNRMFNIAIKNPYLIINIFDKFT
jgi:hypothetical protein